MKLIYVAGPIRAHNDFERELNIRKGEAAAFEIWKLGMAAICPHTNTRNFFGPDACTVEHLLAGDIEMMLRCDAVFFCDGWQQSEGSVGELKAAKAKGMPTFESLPDLYEWAFKEESDNGHQQPSPYS